MLWVETKEKEHVHFLKKIIVVETTIFQFFFSFFSFYFHSDSLKSEYVCGINFRVTNLNPTWMD